MMIVLLLCVIMKIAEFSVGRMSPPFQTPAQPPHLHYGKRKRQERKYYHRFHEKCNCLLYNRKKIKNEYIIFLYMLSIIYF